MEAYPNLLQEWTRAGQGHVFRYWNELNDEQRAILCKQAQSIDVNTVTSVYQKLSKKVSDVKEKKEVEVKPLPDVVTRQKLKEEDEARWAQLGYEALSEGKVAVLLMAGGQGTRLGCDDPKGMYDVGLLSGKSLFQLQAERLLLLQRLTEQVIGKPAGTVQIPWYIMTSFVTDEATKTFFERHQYFGLHASQFFFFNQALFPCVREDDGRILMSSKFEIAIAPNGNGGLWAALRSSGALADMDQRGVTLVASYGVDNILAKLADPVFVGFTLENQKPIACKVVSKTHPEERVGVLCLKDGKPSVIEYSEIDPDRAHAKDPKTGQLLFNAAHIVLNNFTLDFIKQCVLPESDQLSQLPYHIAKKKIPCIDDSPQAHPTHVMGWKFELFFFDVFEFASSISALEVIRAHEFSPLKNSMESLSDNPQTCRQHLSELHKQWALQAGASFAPQGTGQATNEAPLFEISTALSYFGEGLTPHLKGKVLPLPCYLDASNLHL
jgi:UDP-N-acetylglucosamine/UDP-N-acetylgalactosamine diphosphorylase